MDFSKDTSKILQRYFKDTSKILQRYFKIMALKITDECINCDVCEPVCPNQAIYPTALIYAIDPQRCTECVGHFDVPQCRALCPVDCIPNDPEYIESKAILLKKYELLQNTP